MLFFACFLFSCSWECNSIPFVSLPLFLTHSNSQPCACAILSPPSNILLIRSAHSHDIHHHYLAEGSSPTIFSNLTILMTSQLHFSPYSHCHPLSSLPNWPCFANYISFLPPSPTFFPFFLLIAFGAVLIPALFYHRPRRGAANVSFELDWEKSQRGL